MPSEIDDQVSTYFAWVEREAGVALRPPTGRDGSVDAPASGRPCGSEAVGPVEEVFRTPNRRSTRPILAALLAAAAIVGVLALSVRSDDGDGVPVMPATTPTTPTIPVETSPTTAPGEDAALAAASGAAELLPTSPLAGRFDDAVVWTGAEMIVWGGGAFDSSPSGKGPFADGAAYDPLTKIWTMLPDAPITARTGVGAVWTGSEMIVWGGIDGAGSILTDGAAYEPATGRWRMIAGVDLAATFRPTTVWTGREMIVLEGFNGSRRGAAYDPGTDTWRRIAEPPGRGIPPYPQAVWTGELMVAALSDGVDDVGIIAVYDPLADVWQTIDAPTNRGFWFLWTGSEVLTFDGAAWNPSTGTWRTLTSAPPNTLSTVSTYPVWTGSEALFWAGGPSSYAYDPSTDRWRSFDAGGLDQRIEVRAIWADGALLSWSGNVVADDFTDSAALDGIAFRPPASTSTDSQALPVPPTTASAVDPGITMPSYGTTLGGHRGLALGESVMAGAVNRLTDAGFAAVVEESIQGADMIEMIALNVGDSTAFDSVVIQIGTNGPVTQEQYDEMATLLADVPHVYFLTVRAPMAWIAVNNELIRALPTRHPNVSVIEWAVRSEEISGELSASDGGVHLTNAAGARFYANMIIDAVDATPVEEAEEG